MEDLLKIILYSSVAGVTVFLGGLLSRYFERYFQDGLVKEEIIHTSIAFGGGIIIAAVAFVLVPEGMSVLPLAPMALLFLTGAIIFFFLDRYIEKKGGTISQLLAMLMDFVPEAIALGAVFATDHNLGLLLAIFIGLQNLPESFNSYLDLRNNRYTETKCLLILFFLSFSGIFAAISGFFLLSNMPQLTASMMLISSGGILYLIFQDIAPLSKVQKSWFPALGVNIGFLVGMIGQKLLG
ncbi:MAG: divalent cation transporter [Candidatus Scalindua sp. AMX11]|nr:MAG: divalent cation transporter [Candidatus Scalindua sp.]NOG86034.1 divalent cation transporter [Planctomycetota bacterium]RZV91342.1 MAG: divalent cation transporter [Candidatus Scalindua sp. SCAELEC01]TDE65899.1 MAG: divalent cation transporter [Candidatus Scalindua sp. AMX11]GJQ60748.1 MAG: divalent cation transporter [Candidatus Scalindua sp.]